MVPLEAYIYGRSEPVFVGRIDVGMWDELNKFDRGRFTGSNMLVFSPPWTAEQIEWWQDNIFSRTATIRTNLVKPFRRALPGQRSSL
jgi:hypothetical protein